MSLRARARLAVGIALVHAVVLAGVAWAFVGVDALVHPATWIAVAGASLALASEAVSQRRDDTAGQLPLETLTGLLLLALVMMATVGARRSGHVVTAAVAIGLGVVLRVTAVRSLGRAFGTRPRPQDDLVEDGLYAWLRHPSELGLVCLAGGFALLDSSSVGAGAWLLLIALALVRLRREERELERRFGERYRRYRSRSWLSRSSARG